MQHRNIELDCLRRMCYSKDSTEQIRMDRDADLFGYILSHYYRISGQSEQNPCGVPLRPQGFDLCTGGSEKAAGIVL